jgi:hypothetical protein
LFESTAEVEEEEEEEVEEEEVEEEEETVLSTAFVDVDTTGRGGTSIVTSNILAHCLCSRRDISICSVGIKRVKTI